MRTRRAVIPVFAALLLAAGCGHGTPSDPASPPPPVPPAATTTTGATTTTTTPPPPPPKPKAAVLRADLKTKSGGVTVRQWKVKAGKPLTIEVSADVSDEVHVHGIDRTADVTPGKPARMTFTPKAPGVYEIELEGAHLLFALLQVEAG